MVNVEIYCEIMKRIDLNEPIFYNVSVVKQGGKGTYVESKQKTRKHGKNYYS